MNIVVLMKQVPDTETKVRVSADGPEIETQGVSFVVNPYDEFAVEEALKTKEAAGGEVTIVCLGPPEATKEIRTCLAMGADKAVHLVDESSYRDAYSTASILAETIRNMPHDLIFFGKQAVDHDNAQVGLMTATLLGLPAVGEIVSFELAGDHAVVKQEVEGGAQVFEAPLPAVFTAQKGLNEPRYAALKGIMAAKKKPLENLTFQEVESRITFRKVEPPPKRPEGKIVGEGKEAVGELVRLLREEAKVL